MQGSPQGSLRRGIWHLTRYFLDTTILVSASTRVSTQSLAILENSLEKPVTNEYAIKEMRRILQNKFEMPQEEINLAVSKIRWHCVVLPNLQKSAFQKISLDDRSDCPIVASAIQANATLLTRDKKLALQASAYVKTEFQTD